jgi:hypothetical protein
MALPTVQDCKDYLRIEHDAEDTMLTSWLAMALAAATVELGRPITTVTAQEWEDRVENNAMYKSVTKLVIPPENSPFDPTSLAIEDVDAVALSSTVDYYAAVTGLEGTIRARPGMSFSNGPYTLTADVGLATRSDYSTVVEPVSAAEPERDERIHGRRCFHQLQRHTGVISAREGAAGALQSGADRMTKGEQADRVVMPRGSFTLVSPLERRALVVPSPAARRQPTPDHTLSRPIQAMGTRRSA